MSRLTAANTGWISAREGHQKSPKQKTLTQGAEPDRANRAKIKVNLLTYSIARGFISGQGPENSGFIYQNAPFELE